MKFSLAKGPFLRSKRTTTEIMLELFAVLCVVWLTAVISYSVKYNFSVGLRALLVVLVSLVTTLAIDVIMALIKGKRTLKEICKFVLTSYSYVTAIIFALCLPVGTGYYVIIVGSVVATLLGKYVFGGFGYNIFNPAIIGRIFVGLAFASNLQYGVVSLADSSTFDYVTSATVTQNIDWTVGAIPVNYDLKTILFGGYFGAIGETFTLLLLIAAIYLIVRGIINFRLVGSYLITVTFISFFLGLLYNTDNVLMYTLLQLCTGGVMFGAVFMVTDPVTSPKSMNGKIIYGIGIGCLTMLIRVNSAYPEGVMFSIALMNMLTPLIDSCIKGNTFSNIGRKWAVICSFLVGAIGLNVGFNALYPLERIEAGEDDDKESQQNSDKWLEDYEVVKVSEGIYTVKTEAFHGDLKLKVYVDITNEKITKVELVEADALEYWDEGVQAYPSYNIFVGNNVDLKFSDFDKFTCSDNVCNKDVNDNTDFDIETDATYTSSAFIGGLKAVVVTARKDYKWLEDYEVVKVSEGIYTVKTEAFHGDLKLKVYVDITNEKITKVELVEADALEYWDEGVQAYPSYNIFVGNNVDLKFSDFDKFTCSDNVCNKDVNDNTDFDIEIDATYTSSAFIGGLKAVVVYSKLGGVN